METESLLPEPLARTLASRETRAAPSDILGPPGAVLHRCISFFSFVTPWIFQNLVFCIVRVVLVLMAKAVPLGLHLYQIIKGRLLCHIASFARLSRLWPVRWNASDRQREWRCLGALPGIECVARRPYLVAGLRAPLTFSRKPHVRCSDGLLDGFWNASVCQSRIRPCGCRNHWGRCNVFLERRRGGPGRSQRESQCWQIPVCPAASESRRQGRAASSPGPIPRGWQGECLSTCAEARSMSTSRAKRYKSGRGLERSPRSRLAQLARSFPPHACCVRDFPAELLPRPQKPLDTVVMCHETRRKP